MTGTDNGVVIIGAGLAGLVTAAELTAAGKHVTILEAEPKASLGGQAFWSFGGLFLVDSPEQRRLGVKDSPELAFSDWLGSADFLPGAEHGQGPDAWGYSWAEGFVNFAAREMRPWLHGLGVRWFPLVQWAERGGYRAGEHGNTVPRFHVTWGTGPALVEPFVAAALDAKRAGLLDIKFRHRVTGLVTTNGVVTGVRADVLTPDSAPRGTQSTDEVLRSEEFSASAVVVTTGGIGANHDLVREYWPESAGRLPDEMLSGVPASTDGRMISHAVDAGAALVHTERMWHYPEGVTMHSPIWPRHGIRILPGPSSLWLDADGNRLPAPLFPGFDALGALRHITGRGDDHSWFVLNRTIMESEFALSGSDQNPDLTGKDVGLLLKRVLPGAIGPVAEFADNSPEFIWADSPAELAGKMNTLVGDGRIDADSLAHLIDLRDAQVTSGLGKDPQVVATAQARNFVVDRIIRVSPPRPLTTPSDGPLLAVRLSVLTRKTLGGLLTDTEGRVLMPDGGVLPGLYAAGEAAGFGGGGVHGERALEGTFLGGCLFSGRAVARTLVAGL